jgi:ABC-type glycerol-3-phosphate transport system permease component
MNRKISIKKMLSTIGRQVLLVIAAGVVLTPIAYIAMASFKTKMDYVRNQIGIPKPFVLHNYQRLMEDGKLLIWFGNSGIVTAGSVAAAVFLGALAAHGFSRFSFVGKEKIFNFIIALMIIPPIIMIIPLFVLATRASLVNTYWSAVIIYTGLMLPFAVYLLRNFFVTIPLRGKDKILGALLVDNIFNRKPITKSGIQSWLNEIGVSPHTFFGTKIISSYLYT